MFTGSVEAASELVERYEAFLIGDRQSLRHFVSSPVSELFDTLDLLQEGSKAAEGLERLRALLGPITSSDQFSLDAGVNDDDFQSCLRALAGFSHGDMPLHFQPSSVLVSPGVSSRSRIVYQTENAATESTIHLLFSIDWQAHLSAKTYLKYLSGDLAEELGIEIRDREIVVGGGHPLPIKFAEEFRLLTISVVAREMRVFVDGVLIWEGRRSLRRQCTGMNLDVITDGANIGGLSIKWLSMRFESLSTDAPFDTSTYGRVAISALRVGDRAAVRRHFYSSDNPLSLPAYLELPEDVVSLVKGSPSYPEPLVRQLEATFNTPCLISSPPYPLLSLQGVAVEYARDPTARKGLSKILAGAQEQTFKALDNVDINAYPGDIIGVIGKNGAGKSTLLRAIQGSTPLSAGEIKIWGSSMLLRPGTGMSGELSGIQNIVRSAIFMGFSPKEAEDLIAEVVEFAELGQHIEKPYKYYSDGMRARLVFALATTVSPDILMLDELLGAGDRSFQEKAMQRLQDMIGRAKVVLVVQHTTDFVLKQCTKCLYLSNGSQKYFGDPAIAAEMYRND